MMRYLGYVAGLRGVVSLLVLLVAKEAGAFCRTRTCEFPTSRIPCPQDEATGCFTGGAVVSWEGGCFSYAVQRDGSALEGISAEELGELVQSGFRTWSDLRCPGGGSPPISAASQGEIACGAVEYNCQEGEGNSNLVVFRDDFEDTIAFRFGTIALTTLTANLVNGELFDADIEINSRDEDFALGPTRDAVRDLRAVVNHELGHLLGLSHPANPSALMFEEYDGQLLPAADDTAGMCEAMGSEASNPECRVVPLPSDAGCIGAELGCVRQARVEDGDEGCACEVGGASPPRVWSGLGLLVLAGYSWRIRRAKRAR